MLIAFSSGGNIEVHKYSESFDLLYNITLSPGSNVYSFGQYDELTYLHDAQSGQLYFLDVNGFVVVNKSVPGELSYSTQFLKNPLGLFTIDVTRSSIMKISKTGDITTYVDTVSGIDDIHDFYIDSHENIYASGSLNVGGGYSDKVFVKNYPNGTEDLSFRYAPPSADDFEEISSFVISGNEFYYTIDQSSDD